MTHGVLDAPGIIVKPIMPLVELEISRRKGVYGYPSGSGNEAC
jgi:hypothetical protein